jgi:hypothetical protein
MPVVNESNFPNSRITATIQGLDTLGNIKNITARSVGLENGLAVYMLGGTSGSDVNVKALAGIEDFSIGNPMIKENYDIIGVTYQATSDIYEFFKGIALKATLVITYTDGTKENILSVVRT